MTVNAAVDLDLKSLRAFVEVARTLSFTGAATKLNSSQPRISLRVQNLEERLGYRLFYRTAKGVQLTAEGEQFFDHAQAAVNEMDRVVAAAEQIAHRVDQRLLIGASPLFTQERWSILERFIARHPRALPRVATGTSAVLLQQLRTKEIDLAFLVGDVPTFCRSIVLWTSRFGLVFPADSPLKDNDEIAIEQLAGQNVFMFPREAITGLHDHLRQLLAPLDIGLLDQMEANSEAITQQVRNNGRLVVTPRWWADDSAPPDGIAYRPIAGITESVSFTVVRQASIIPRPAQQLWDMLAAQAA